MSESAFIERALEPSVANADARFRSCDAEANGERRGDASFHARGSFASERVERAALPKKTMVSGHAPAPSRSVARARASPRSRRAVRWRRGDTARAAAHAGRRRGRAAKVAAVAARVRRPRVRRPRVAGPGRPISSARVTRGRGGARTPCASSARAPRTPPRTRRSATEATCTTRSGTSSARSRRSAASEAARDRRHDRPRRRGGASARPRPESQYSAAGGK